MDNSELARHAIYFNGACLSDWWIHGAFLLAFKGGGEMKRVDQMNERERAELLKQYNKPMTNEYRENFWQKTYDNENLLTEKYGRPFHRDAEFMKRQGITSREASNVGSIPKGN